MVDKKLYKEYNFIYQIENMNLKNIENLKKGIENGLLAYEAAKVGDFNVCEKHGTGKLDNILAKGDNLSFIKYLTGNGYLNKFKLIYIDPPFFTKAKYDASIDISLNGKKKKIGHLAYDDTFQRDMEYYITNISARLFGLKELLSDEGLIWVHLDWHSSHYVKIILDEIFGYDNFINEIIWKYKSGGTGKRHFSRKHDSILVYAKSKHYFLNIGKEKSYNRNLMPYRFKGIKEYRDEFGWYTMVNTKDVWTVDMVGRTSNERNGYATQKPIELLKKIISSSTIEDDLVGDFFSGSGTLAEAAVMMNRKFIVIDNGDIATSISKKRLDNLCAKYVYLSEGKNNNSKSNCHIVKQNEEMLENGKKWIKYSLENIDIDIDYGHISNKDRAAVLALAEKNPLSFVDYIMVDPNYDGEFNSEVIITEKFDDIRILSYGNAYFIVVDKFGKEYFSDGK